MKVLVTGSGGFIGAVMCPILMAEGHEVVGLDTGFYDGCDFGPYEVEHPRIALDVRDVQPEHLAGFDAVVHLAALSNDPLGDLAPELTHDINFQGTVTLARAARTAGVGRFVFASSCSMYGAAEGDAQPHCTEEGLTACQPEPAAIVSAHLVQPKLKTRSKPCRITPT